MVRQFFSFQVAAAAIIFTVGISAPFASQAQEEKLIREPVFRQARLPGQPTPAERTKANQQEDGEQAGGPRVASNTPTNDVNANNRSITGDASMSEAVIPPEATPAKPPHPLDRAINVAESGLDNMRTNVFDYTALMVKRERVNGKLGDVEYMRIKVRNDRETAAGHTPLSIYMSFLKPKAVKGREVIWVNGENDGKLMVHEGSGVGSFKTFHLDPTGWLAMKGNRYPISEAGLENLIVRLIEKASRDRAAGDCVVNYREGAKINGRSCSMIEVVHAEQRAPYEFHKAQVFIDDELQLPVRYASYGWPAQAGGKPVLMEEYTYVEVELNVGLTDEDFDPNNSEYRFPGF